MRKIIVLFIIAVLTVSMGVVCAAPADTVSFLQTNPDGTTLEIYTYGDETYNFVGDKDGYLLEKNEDGEYEYVVGETSSFFSSADSLRPAGAVKGFNLKPETIEETKNLRHDIPVKRNAFFSSSDIEVTTNNVLVIAVDFNDVQIDPEIFTPEKFYDMYFDDSADAVSLNTYYMENSGGRQNFAPAFTLPDDYVNETGYGKIADGVVKVKIDGNHPDPETYGTGTENWRNGIDSIITDAFALVDEYIDFTELDIDKLNDYYGHKFIYNGELNICFVVAGYEMSTGLDNEDNSVWAHMSNMNYGDIICDGIYLLANPPYVIDGVVYNISSNYVMYGAMYNDTNPLGIGTLCHEMGHTFGLPDMYNTVSSAEYGDIKTLGLMASGNWCRDSLTAIPSAMPSSLDPWSKSFLGWIGTDEMLVVDADDKQTAELVSRNSDEEGYRYIRVNTTDPDEYYILENITFDGYDKSLQYHSVYGISTPGILVWHIDESVVWERLDSNDINGYEDAGIKVLRTGKGLSDFYSYNSPFWSYGLNKIPFLGDTSYPKSKLNTYTESSDSGIDIQFESAPADKMTVSFGEEDVNTAVYSKNGKMAVRVFNNTQSELTVTPVIARYGESCLDEALVFDEITPASSGSAQTTKKTFSSDEEFRVFNLSMPTVKPITKSLTYK